MKILFVPMAEGGLSHLIPLIALNNMITNPMIKTAFLVPEEMKRFLHQLGIYTLNINHQPNHKNGFRTELSAYAQYQPDIVIDDGSLTTGYATTLAKKPRITIQRTGIFPGTIPTHKHHQHSTEMDDLSTAPDVTFLGLPQPQRFSDLFQADLKIVPGIPAIEQLTPLAQQDPTYYFCGPLWTDDYLVHIDFELIDIQQAQQFDTLQRFFDQHQHRSIVYITLGNKQKANSPLFDCIHHLLSQDIAIVSSIPMPYLSPSQKERYYSAPYLPMHLVCSYADLMIHQCGSATYQYAIIHQRPNIVVGTQYYDRVDVALRLQELGASCYLPSPDECKDFLGRFQQLTHTFLGGSPTTVSAQKQILRQLAEETVKTMALFDFERLLYIALETDKDWFEPAFTQYIP